MWAVDRRGSVGGGRLSGCMEDTPIPLSPAEPRADLVGALRAAHAALDAVSVLDVDGFPAGWGSIEGCGAEELGEVVRLAARLEGRVAGLKLHVVAAAEQVNAAEVDAATDTGAWAAKSDGG